MKLAQGSYYGTKTRENNETVGVEVNNRSLRVGDRLYPYDIISSLNVCSITPNRKSGILLLILGMSFAIVGFLQPIEIFSLEILGRVFSPYELIYYISAVLCIAGMITLFMLSKRYALRITMENNEVDAIVSSKKHRINKIAMNINNKMEKFDRTATLKPEVAEQYSRRYHQKQQA